MKKILITLLFLISSLISSAYAKDSKFTLKRGNQFELCQEIKQILNEPENDSVLEVYVDVFKKIKPNEQPPLESVKRHKYIFSTSEFIIPSKYKNFKLPIWEDIDSEEFLKHVPNLPEDLVTSVKSGKITEFKKTKFDLANNKTNETVLTFNVNNRGESKKFWACDVSEIAPRSVVSETYNERYDSGDCFFFYYKGRIYKAESEWNDLMIREPKMVMSQTFAMTPVCIFNPK